MAAFKSLSFPLAILTIWVALYSFQAAASSAATPAPAPGGRRTVIGFQPIENLTDPSVVKIAKFAVAAHNKHPKATKLELVRIIGGRVRVTDGLTYRLLISTTEKGSNSTKRETYLASVFQKLGGKVLKLISFRKFLIN
ncbi:cysteine proteinase inhibitor 6 [Phtheirospermum japonicum]|uniref:Cysteine proteinase inhibitor 6 n=1 Tax=Phtheirospermum japonicum TaxID=374723 RepID=A0A830BV48_9LAMI|nr:cysteine proteinase inhibitor 6 [Phtheirospermum japonicum]